MLPGDHPGNHSPIMINICVYVCTRGRAAYGRGHTRRACGIYIYIYIYDHAAGGPTPANISQYNIYVCVYVCTRPGPVRHPGMTLCSFGRGRTLVRMW